MHDDPRLRAFADAVIASPHNLVSQRAKDELWERHVLESAALAEILPGPGRLLDVGSGGGLPGMVIALRRPDLQVTLLDSSQKKTTFLADVITELDVDVAVERGRAEDVRSGPLGQSFDIVTARAVAPLGRLLGWTIPFLVPGGLLYAVKGERWREELAEAVGELRTWDAQVMATPPDQPSEDPHQPRVVVLRRGTKVGT
ncbi:16S rRNA (guanine(527)-N(7))-methyltransferase RsmG [Salsipaludibacter albus]|uniref:16S rRNA (guanine(527)-N(7))-methyltransferase RsmG n=1 Tax=Salsipaludibacter albus TaxID=2849650 RepID=UPI001EE432B3|nr:16S rRNA (guanine(527)-N(7))-methyltransferase RsmG [Salsipaludibacter albus]